MLATQVFLPPLPSLPRGHSASQIIAGERSCGETQGQDGKKRQESDKLSPAVLPEQLTGFCLLHGNAWLQAPHPGPAAAARTGLPGPRSWPTHCQHPQPHPSLFSRGSTYLSLTISLRFRGTADFHLLSVEHSQYVAG